MSEKKVLLRCIVVFKKINNEFERYIKYIDSDGIMMRYGSNVDKIINELYVSLLKSYENESNKLRGSNFVFSSVGLSYLQVIKIKLKKVGTYIETPKWLSNKKAIINSYNIDDDLCFVWSIIISIHYDEINRNHNRISKLKKYIKNYDWNGIKFPIDKSDWDKLEKQNLNIALNIFSTHETSKKLNNIRVSEYNRIRPNKILLLMITDGKKWHFTSVKNEQRLFRDAFSKHHDAYYCLNCRQSYRTDKSLKKHERLCLNNKDCHVKLPNKNNNILKYEKDMRSIKSPNIIYADLECLLKNIYDNTNVNENESYQIKNNLHVPCGYGINFVRSYDKNILTYYRGTDCIEKFVKSIKLICSIIINTKQTLHKQLTRKQTYEYNKRDKYIVCKNFFKDNKHKNVKYCYFTGEYIGALHKYCDKKVIEVPVAFHNGSNYNYHFIIKELAKKVDGLVCIGENSEKYITFKATININETETKLKFIDTFRFTSNSLDTLVNNLTELNKCKKCNKECNNYIKVKNTVKYSCNECKKVSYKFTNNLINKCSNVYSICNGDLDKCL